MPFELRSLFCCIPYLRLEVQGAQHMPGGTWLADFNPGGGNVTITAYTVVGTPIAWAIVNGVGAATPGGDQYNVSLNNAANINPVGTTIQVTCTAAGLAQTVQIEIKPFLQQLTVRPNHYAFQDPGGAWYAYNLIGIAPNHFLPPNVAPTAEIEAHVLPAGTPNVWGHVHWIAATTAMPPVPVALTPGGAPGIQGIPLDAVRTVRVTVGILGSAQPAHQVTVDVRPPGNGVNLANNLGVQLDQFIFAGAGRFAVTQEHAAYFNAEYSRRWRRNWAATPRPQGYAASSAMQLNAVMVSVTQAPTANTNLSVRASIYFPLANGNITVLAGATAGAAVANGTVIGTQFNLGNIVPAINVPNEVMRHDPLLIFWEANNGGGWQPIALTTNAVYVTARAPVATTDGQLNSPAGPVFTYPTLLHISCEAARGVPGAPGAAGTPPVVAALGVVKAAIYATFNPANPNPRVVRLNPPAGPPTQLTYWWNWAGGAAPAQSLNQAVVGGTNLFTDPNSNIACGVWAKMLMAMWALHGDGTGRFIGVWSSKPGLGAIGLPPFPPLFPGLPNIVGQTRFMVRNWDYSNHGALNAANYTHAIIGVLPFGPGNETVPVLGGNGQNNANPPPQFNNHFIVRDGVGGDFYDPSYGTAPSNRNTWIDASLAGLRNDATNTGGFVQVNPGLANGIQTNHNAVALYDFVANNWLP